MYTGRSSAHCGDLNELRLCNRFGRKTHRAISGPEGLRCFPRRAWQYFWCPRNA